MLGVSTPPDDLRPPADIDLCDVRGGPSVIVFLSFSVDEPVSCIFWTFEGFSSVHLFLMLSVATVTTVNTCFLFNEN